MNTFYKILHELIGIKYNKELLIKIVGAIADMYCREILLNGRHYAYISPTFTNKLTIDNDINRILKNFGSGLWGHMLYNPLLKTIEGYPVVTNYNKYSEVIERHWNNGRYIILLEYPTYDTFKFSIFILWDRDDISYLTRSLVYTRKLKKDLQNNGTN